MVQLADSHKRIFLQGERLNILNDGFVGRNEDGLPGEIGDGLLLALEDETGGVLLDEGVGKCSSDSGVEEELDEVVLDEVGVVSGHGS